MPTFPSNEQLLAPVSDAAPCGRDMAFSSELDAIARARQADDPSLEQGAWVTTLKEADWKFVAARCAALIASASKDLRLAVWLAEARAKSAGLRGLGEGLLLVAALCERYWEQLFPLPDEGDHEQRIGNLCWIAARAPQLIREIALTGGPGTAYCLNDPDGRFLLEAIGVLEQAVDRRLGIDGPGFSAARTALEELIHFVTPGAPDAGAGCANEGQGQGAAAMPDGAHGAPAGGEAGRSAPAAPVPGAPLQDRAQALAQLRMVAAFFRRTEPHSPVAYLADKAANWGEQPLHVWLRGVVKDPSAFAHLEELLGIGSAPD